MKDYMATGNTGRFLGLFSTFVNAAFSYAGVEIVAVASGESKNPKRNLPKAARRIFWRILFFYSLGSLAIGVLVPYTEPSLLSQQAAGVKTAAASPWVIAIQRASIPALPSIINAVILSSALSSGNAFLYTGSHYLLALASNGHAPKILLKTTTAGNPIYCVAVTSIFSLLTYLSVSSGPNQIFPWFQSLSTMCTLQTWSSICVAYLHFYGALKANHVDRGTLVHRAPLQPYGTIIILIFFLIIIVFNGFAIFFPRNWEVYNFVTAYIGIPIFFILLFGFKLLNRTHWLPCSERDLYTGKAEIDALDEIWEHDKPKNSWQRIFELYCLGYASCESIQTYHIRECFISL
ncbi:Proline-specific permease [Fusarium oxysporum f. sp. raphani]|nr:Proline-specific permease [Fusarium oxysporum f. sp. raphani]